MNLRMTSEVRRLVGPLDPVSEPLVGPEERRADLQRILATTFPAPVPARPAVRRRPMMLTAGVAAAVLVLVVVAGTQVVGFVQPAYAATPALLSYANGGGDAAALLTGIAARAAGAPGPARTGPDEHLIVQSWNLFTQIDGEQVRTAVVPVRTESWRSPTDAGRVDVRYGEPEFPAGSTRLSWRLQGSPGGEASPNTEIFAAGKFPAMWKGPLPRPSDMKRFLAIGHPSTNGPAETLVAVNDLARERVLTPALRAAALRTLAALPGLTYDGAVTDRAGRSGQAFSVVSGHTGLPTRHTVIVDPATGALLGYESTLTTTAGKLGVRVPAVISYDTYVTAEYGSTPR
ncbi:CU044_5270 family protein [Paractinoplanes rishiriensis]|uniref:CU044_5270 family protein n=1 Tax=Paractinoplanes rishiriensis TaxID=1050105 RepID=A0A919MZM3_9ACTN|nr:CU044_5270 family protein [Actinoplanes rishiriensis]GIF01709.1 hypothetical protein Ari01nite_91730 [Actinoplanes rishiriensis]